MLQLKPKYYNPTSRALTATLRTRPEVTRLGTPSAQRSTRVLALHQQDTRGYHELSSCGAFPRPSRSSPASSSRATPETDPTWSNARLKWREMEPHPLRRAANGKACPEPAKLQTQSPPVPLFSSSTVPLLTASRPRIGHNNSTHTALNELPFSRLSGAYKQLSRCWPLPVTWPARRAPSQSQATPAATRRWESRPQLCEWTGGRGFCQAGGGRGARLSTAVLQRAEQCTRSWPSRS